MHFFCHNENTLEGIVGTFRIPDNLLLFVALFGYLPASRINQSAAFGESKYGACPQPRQQK